MEVAGHHCFLQRSFSWGSSETPLCERPFTSAVACVCLSLHQSKRHTCERETRVRTQTHAWLLWGSIRFLKWSLNCPKISEMIVFFFSLSFIGPLVNRLNKVGVCSLDFCVTLLLNNSWISSTLRLNGSLQPAAVSFRTFYMTFGHPYIWEFKKIRIWIFKIWTWVCKALWWLTASGSVSGTTSGNKQTHFC